VVLARNDDDDDTASNRRQYLALNRLDSPACYYLCAVVSRCFACCAELFLTNFSTGSLSPFHRTAITPLSRCLRATSISQFCVIEVTAATFSLVILDPTKVTARTHIIRCDQTINLSSTKYKP